MYTKHQKPCLLIDYIMQGKYTCCWFNQNNYKYLQIVIFRLVEGNLLKIDTQKKMKNYLRVFFMQLQQDLWTPIVRRSHHIWSVILQPLSAWLSAWLSIWLCRLDYPLIFTTGFRLLLPTQLVSCVRSAGAAESMRRWLISQLTAANELWYVQLLPNPITNCITNLW